jgi:predicted HicB family RNase H-like nuclease
VNTVTATLRMPEALHDRLAEQASRDRRSLNAEAALAIEWWLDSLNLSEGGVGRRA